MWKIAVAFEEGVPRKVIATCGRDVRLTSKNTTLNLVGVMNSQVAGENLVRSAVAFVHGSMHATYDPSYSTPHERHEYIARTWIHDVPSSELKLGELACLMRYGKSAAPLLVKLFREAEEIPPLAPLRRGNRSRG